MPHKICFRMASIEHLNADLQTLKSFYQSFPTGFVKDRGEPVLKQIIEDEKMLMGFDTEGRLVAVTGEFAHNNQDHLEIGGVLVAQETGGVSWRGFGLQKVMMSILAIRIQFAEPPEGEVFAITAKNNFGSITNIQRAGFRQVENLSKLQISTNDLESTNPDKAYFLYDKQQNKEVACMLSAIYDAGGINKNGKFIAVSLDIPYIRKGYLADFT